MDEAQKKPLMIGIIVVCLVVAVAVTIKTWSGDSAGIPRIMKEQEVWMKCRNPACKTTYEMNKYDYFKTIEDYMLKHNTGIAAGLECKECGEPAVYIAHKCEKCGYIFEKGWKTGDYEDRCPECEHSSIEIARKKKAGIIDDE